MPIKRIPKQPSRPVGLDYVASDNLFNGLLISLKDIVACQSVLANHGNGRNGNATNELELQKLRLAINKVINLHHRIKMRGVELNEVLAEATNKIDLDLHQLLKDCLRFPEIFPHAKNKQGLRKFFLCHCEKNETVDQQGLRFCFACLEAALECLKERKKDERFILYSSYSPQVRCRHADFKTLLITFNKPGLWPPAWCAICLEQERLRLTKLPK